MEDILEEIFSQEGMRLLNEIYEKYGLNTYSTPYDLENIHTYEEWDKLAEEENKKRNE